MDPETPLVVEEASNSTIHTTPRRKPRPKTDSIKFKHTYTPSQDGIDENLLILLHGLGE